MSIKGLSPSESEKLRAAIFQRESAGKGGYQAINQFNFAGGYQMGVSSLESVGLMKQGSSRGGNSAIYNEANWNIPGGLQTFLNNPQIQDKAFYDLANKNVSRLEATGIINSNTSAGDKGGYVAAAHLLGADGATDWAKRNPNRSDANGTTGTSFFNTGKSAVTGAPATPPVRAPGSNSGTSSSKSASKTPSAPPPPPTGDTNIGRSVVVFGDGETRSDAEPGIQVNELEKFTSFNYIFTLSCLDNKQINFPEAPNSYKGNAGISGLGNIICRSGGGAPDNRVRTAYVSERNNPSGKFEYYIDSLEMDLLMTFNRETRGSNATKINFTVIEPYSMGIFLQSMQLAALDAAHSNYLTAPFLLTMEFIGSNSDGTIIQIPRTTRHIPLRIKTIDMEVTSSGCKYSVQAYAWNEIALVDTFNLLREDLAVSGKTVVEILQTGERSLQYWLNAQLQEMNKKDKEKSIADEIVIIFPKPKGSDVSDPARPNSTGSSALINDEGQVVRGFRRNEETGEVYSSEGLEDLYKNENSSVAVNPGPPETSSGIQSRLTITRAENALLRQDPSTLNEIGSSSMGFTANTGGESSQGASDDVQTADGRTDRTKNNYDPKDRVFRFPQGTSIVNAITEILLMSEYCKTSAESASDSRGFKKWFRIETQVYNMDPIKGNDGKGYSPKLLVYKVVLYNAHESRFLSPTSAPKGYEELKKAAVKEYNYLYSGKNTDVLRFDISLKTGFFSTAFADKNSFSGSVYPQINGASTQRDSAQPGTDNSFQSPPELGGGYSTQGVITDNYRNSGGANADDYRSRVAKNFQEALLNGQVDLVKVETDILGDPYYIADSGVGNYLDKPVGTNLNENGSINYQNGEVDILVNFRTPVDYAADTGIMDFGNSKLVEAFSGLYHVLRIKNAFISGKFTQTLSMVRRQNQNPIGGQVFDTSGSEAIRDETGQVSNLRRNLETGELYDATGLYNDQGKPVAVNPNNRPSPPPNAPSGDENRTPQTTTDTTVVPLPGELNSPFQGAA